MFGGTKDEEDGDFFHLVSFVGYEDENGQKLIDIVLDSWVRYSKKTNNYVSKYPPPPYDRSTLMELNNLLKTFSKAPGFWPEYPVNFHGDARTFSVAQKRLLQLKNKEYAFTSDGRGPEKVEETKRKFREKKLSVRPEEEEKLFDVPSIAEEMHQLRSSDESIFSLSKMNLEKNINDGSKIKSNQPSKKPKRTRKADSSQSSNTDDSISSFPKNIVKKVIVNCTKSKSAETSKKSKRNHIADKQNTSSSDQSLGTSSNNSMFSLSPALDVDNGSKSKNAKNSNNSKETGDAEVNRQDLKLPGGILKPNKPSVSRKMSALHSENCEPSKTQYNLKRRASIAGDIDFDFYKSVQIPAKKLKEGDMNIKENEYLDIFCTTVSQKERDDPILLQLRMIKCLHVIHIDVRNTTTID